MLEKKPNGPDWDHVPGKGWMSSVEMTDILTKTGEEHVTKGNSAGPHRRGKEIGQT